MLWLYKEHTGEYARLGPREAKGKGKRGICTARKDDIHVAAQLDEQQLVTIIVIVTNYMFQQMLGVCGRSLVLPGWLVLGVTVRMCDV